VVKHSAGSFTCTQLGNKRALIFVQRTSSKLSMLHFVQALQSLGGLVPAHHSMTQHSHDIRLALEVAHNIVSPLGVCPA
jgi:hypothetical protein